MYANRRNRDCFEELAEWWKNVPMFTMFIGVIVVLLYLMIFFPFYSIEFTILLLGNFLNGSYWTILTYPFQSFTILRTILSLYLYLPLAARSERRNGTVRYMFFFFFTTIIIGLIFLASSFYLINYPQVVKFLYGSGLWGLFMTEVVLECYEKPNENGKLFGCLCPIKNKFIPWIYLILLTIFTFNFMLTFIGTALGFICNF